ncbi:MAG: ribonuclease P protein component [Polyangiaceae bacterium]|nr:ribonuclease P protein component [Polyangiaceae bacterium]
MRRPAFAFGAERRILRRSDFLRVQAEGERAMTPHFVLLVAARACSGDASNRTSCGPRLGVVVTKKIGHAPARSRVKRLCRECFRQWPHFVPDGIELVVIARAGANELGLGDVRDEWARARPVVLRRCSSLRKSVENTR